MGGLFGTRHVEGFEQSRVIAVEHIAIEEQQRRNSGSRQRRARELPKRLRFQAAHVVQMALIVEKDGMFDQVDIALLSAPGLGELRRAPGRAVFRTRMVGR